ncbi:MAG: cytochrome c oxidase subunit II [Planctomycetota bacterium]
MTLLGDYVEEGSFFPISASSFAEDNDWLFAFISWTCVAFFVPIAFALFYFCVRYRKAPGGKAESNAAHNTPLEVAWSVIPSFFLVAMFALGALSYLDQRTIPDGANEVKVQAYKWGWGFDYGNGVINPELHILKGEPTKLSMRSTDVIHSLYVPAFRAKKDIVPGRYNYMWFKPTIANDRVPAEDLAAMKEQFEARGESWNYDEAQFTPDGYEFYDLYCTEYCGKNHSEMQAVVVVHEELDDLKAWVKENSKRKDGVPPAEYGENLYQNRGCKGCHSLDGSRMTGPTWQNMFGYERDLANGDKVVADENYLRESVLYPKAKVAAGYQPVMPSYKGQLSDDDLYCLIEYMKTLSDKAPSVSVGGEAGGDEPTESAGSED